jgi:hypothetical protein
MNATTVRFPVFASGFPRLFALAGVFAAFAGTGRAASDIGGEFVPAPCAYDSHGIVAPGFPPECAGLSKISALSPGGVVLRNILFSATPAEGSVANPFHWTDDVSGLLQANLFMEGTLGPLLPLPADPQLEGNALGGLQFFSRMISETLVNDTSTTWTGIYIELRTDLGTPSSNTDGLSFGQISRSDLVVLPTSDRFGTVSFVTAASDSITFAGGSVAPGQSVVLNFPISLTVVYPGFYLLQQPIAAEQTPEPRSGLLLVIGLAALVCLRRAAFGAAVLGNADRSATPRSRARR